MTRIALLVVAGDPVRAMEVTEGLFPAGHIELIRMAELKYGSRLAALRRLRRARADTLLLCYESVEVIGERPLHELVARAMGASHLVLLDQEGRTKCRSLAGPPVGIALRLAREAILGAMFLLTINAVLPLLGRRRGGASVPQRSPDDSESGTFDVGYVRSLGQPTVSNVGGAASHTVGIVRAFGDLGHSVHVISRPPAPDFRHPSASVTIFNYGPTFFRLHPLLDLENHLRFLWRSWRLVVRDRPSLLYQRHTRFDPSGSVLALLIDRPLVLEHEGSEELMAKSGDPTSCLRTLRVCERLNHRVASLVVAVSEEVRRDLVRHRGVSAEKVIVNPSGVDASRFAPDSGGAQRRAALGISPQTTVVGFSGTFEPWHGTDVLVEAILSLPADLDLCFLFVGDGGDRVAVQLRLAEGRHNCVFVGLVSFSDMPSYLDACDVLVCPTTPMPGRRDFFGSPTKLFEYMAMEKGIIASNIGQVADVITDGVNGLLTPPCDSAKLAESILRLAHDVELRTMLARAAREDVVQSYSWTRNATAVIEQLERSCRAARPEPAPTAT